MAEVEEEEHAELTVWRCPEAYLYTLPVGSGASSLGHRAEVWGVEDWFKAVRVRVVTVAESCFVRMEDTETGELFAECPLPEFGVPLSTAVEAVIDSSRYYVMRIVDRERGRHAFLGLGYRNREESSEFMAALDDHVQYLRRKKEAIEAKKRWDTEKKMEAEAGGDGDAGAVREKKDMSLKEGQTIKIALKGGNNSSGGTGSLAQKLKSSLNVSKAGSERPTGGGILAPPPSLAAPLSSRAVQPLPAVTPPPKDIPPAQGGMSNDDSVEDEDEFGDFQ